jgi:hypothetical protein
MLRPSEANYLLRWRFDFSGKPTVYGRWSAPATRDEEKAAFVNTEGLVRAAVEAKNPITYETLILAECDGHDYVMFKWNACLVGGINLAKGGRHVLTGLKLVTTELEMDVYPSGEVAISKRTAEDKKFHYAGFGR